MDLSIGFLDLKSSGTADGAEHRRLVKRGRRISSAAGSCLSTVVQLALSSLTDFCQHNERAFAEEDFKLDLSGDGKEKKDDFDDDFSMIVFKYCTVFCLNTAKYLTNI